MTVTPAPNGYEVTFNKTGAQMVLTGGEPAVNSDGTTTEVVQGVVPVPANNIAGVLEDQNVTVNINPFFLNFEYGGVTQSTTLLPANATLAQVQTALNALTTVSQAGGVIVTAGTGNSNPGYNVQFQNFGPQSLISVDYAPYSKEITTGNATTSTDEVQQVAVLPTDPFTLTFQGQTTTQLLASDTPMDVQNALNALSAVQSAGDVTVQSATANTTPNTGYLITFGNAGIQPLIIPNFSLGVTQTVTGGASVASVQTLALPTRGDFGAPQFATANLVGSIYDIQQENAAVFHFTQLEPSSSFVFGDAPQDGLIAAVSLTSFKNFIPEAFVTTDASGDAILVDNTVS